MKQTVIGAVIGAVVILAIGGAVLLGTQLDDDQGGQGSQGESARPAPNAQARSDYIRFCEDVLNSSEAIGGSLDCACIADEVEARKDPSSLTTEEAYAGAAESESVISPCIRD